MTGDNNKAAALAIIRGIISDATQVAKVAREIGGEADKPDGPGVSAAELKAQLAPSASPVEKMLPEPAESQSKASTQADVLALLRRNKQNE